MIKLSIRSILIVPCIFCGQISVQLPQFVYNNSPRFFNDLVLNKHHWPSNAELLKISESANEPATAGLRRINDGFQLLLAIMKAPPNQFFGLPQWI